MAEMTATLASSCPAGLGSPSIACVRLVISSPTSPARTSRPPPDHRPRARVHRPGTGAGTTIPVMHNVRHARYTTHTIPVAQITPVNVYPMAHAKVWAMSRFRLTCVGTHALLMHNSRLSNPLDPTAKAMKRITSKRIKTEEDHVALAQLEHAGGLYFDPDLGPYLPGQNFERCLVDAARITKSGKKIERGVFIDSDINPLFYDGPRDAELLWKDENFRHSASVKVGTQRVTRTRPQFRQWKVDAEGQYDPSVINLQELAEIADTAGKMIGLGDWRPRFGRFVATVEKIS